MYSINYMNIVVEQRNVMLDAWNLLQLVSPTPSLQEPLLCPLLLCVWRL